MAKRILIVDDDRQCAQLVTNMLEMGGYETQEVYGGSDALRRLSQDQFDMALIDFDMRDIKGDRICLMLRLEEKTKDFPIMIMTAHVERDEKIFRDFGATEVIYKPLDSKEFLDKIKKCLHEGEGK
jgi:DNA-binding response OmpR family regulator